MSIKFTKLSTVLVIAIFASLFSIETKAEMKSLDKAFNDAYFTRGKNAFEQSNIFGQMNAILGFTGFADQHINVDGKKVDHLYQEAMKKQTETGSRMVTQDLANPYETSLKENPSYLGVK